MKRNDEIDIRDLLFETIQDRRFAAEITAERTGILYGCEYALRKLREMNLEITFFLPDGSHVTPGIRIAGFSGSAKQITMAEEIVIGIIAKTSGIATAAARAAELSQGKCKIASGAWKKMPHQIKEIVREAIRAGGISTRLIEEPFIYLDKNYVRIFGGISPALQAAERFEDYVKVIQLKKETGDIAFETRQAAEAGADVIMVDTGDLQDVLSAIETLENLDKRALKRVAFGKDVKIEEIPIFVKMGVDLLCIGKEIVDARLLDMRLDIIAM
ncbi:MAG: quinolinate phosphoribosyl transferase [Eubacteriales bacterium]|nr:quinolinate phosphoribosyl transferase [Eubacteriales bacterium]